MSASQPQHEPRALRGLRVQHDSLGVKRAEVELCREPDGQTQKNGRKRNPRNVLAWTKQKQSRLHLSRLLTLCSLAVDNARTSQEGPKTAPPGTTSLSACGRINPHTRGSSGSTGCSLPSEGPGGRHRGTRSCPLCLCRSRRTRSSRTHPRLKRQEVTETRVGLLFKKKSKQFPLTRSARVAVSPLQVLEVKLYWKPLGHLHSYMPGVLTHRAGSLQMLGYNWHSSISGTDSRR